MQEAPKFRLWTWGSCGRGYLDMLHPVRLSLSSITRHSGTVKTDWFTIDVVNMDSRKNMHRDVTFLDVFQPIIVRHHGAYSCSQSFDNVYLLEKLGDNIVVKELPIQVETKTEVQGRLLAVKEVRFVEYAGERIVLSEREVSKTKTAYVVTIRTVNDKVVVSGDTYEIRETLKRLGLRWDPVSKAWHAPAKVGIENIKAELEKIPEVIVKEG
jgi:hypothetical protein